MESKGHIVFIPAPSQSHIKQMLKFAKLLHYKGFHITFVNTEFIHKRFLRSRGHNSLNGLPSFQFETIPDGLPLSNSSDDEKIPMQQDIYALFENVYNNVMLQPFLDLLAKLDDRSRQSSSSSSSSSSNVNKKIPPVNCIMSDVFMSFTIKAAEKVGLPAVIFFPVSVSCLLESQKLWALKSKGLIKLKDERSHTKEYLDTVVEGIPGMKDICIRDLLSYIRSTNLDNDFFNSVMTLVEEASKASAFVCHSFDALEQQILDDLSSKFPNLFAIGPLQLLINQIEGQDCQLNSIGYNLWKEEIECLKWLDSKQPDSVIYINFGSLIVMTKQQLVEVAMGLANSDHQFLWIIREDLVIDDKTDLPDEFEVKAKGKCFIASWCPQEEVLNHPSVGGFLTHCGWGSTIESLSAGVPMICWPFFGDQSLNCRCVSDEWKVGMEIRVEEEEKIRNDVEKLVRELMEGEKGKRLSKKAVEWKRLAKEAVAAAHGSSYVNLEKFVNKILMPKA